MKTTLERELKVVETADNEADVPSGRCDLESIKFSPSNLSCVGICSGGSLGRVFVHFRLLMQHLCMGKLGGYGR